jgi:hypothetical protein
MSDYIERLPKRWRVGAATYVVRVVGRDHPKLNCFDDGEPGHCLGLSDFSEKRVWLDQSQGPANFYNTVWHELIHLINECFGVVDGSDEETITTQAANGLCAVLRDNPRLARWFYVTNRDMAKHEDDHDRALSD